MGLIHRIYASSATQDFSTAEVEALLRQCRTNNARLGVSGILVHVDSSFFQVLEGEAAEVDALYAIIARDPRHSRVTTIVHEPIPRRAFADWSMGFAECSAAELGVALGTNDFFEDGRCLHALGPGRARKLLTAFSAGRWRQRATRARAPLARAL